MTDVQRQGGNRYRPRRDGQKSDRAGCGSRSISKSCWHCAKPRPAPPPGSSTASRSRRPRAAGRGDDAARKVEGRKRDIVTDTTGLMVAAAVHPADVQDRNGAPLVFEAIPDLFPWLRHFFADSATRGIHYWKRPKNPAAGASTSSNGWPTPLASKSPRAAGSSNAPPVGSTATAVSPKTSKPPFASTHAWVYSCLRATSC